MPSFSVSCSLGEGARVVERDGVAVAEVRIVTLRRRPKLTR